MRTPEQKIAYLYNSLTSHLDKMMQAGLVEVGTEDYDEMINQIDTLYSLMTPEIRMAALAANENQLTIN